MTLSELHTYAEKIGCDWQTRTFDDGQTVSIGTPDGMTTWRGSYHWDQYDEFVARLSVWLHGLPRPNVTVILTAQELADVIDALDAQADALTHQMEIGWHYDREDEEAMQDHADRVEELGRRLLALSK